MKTFSSLFANKNLLLGAVVSSSLVATSGSAILLGMVEPALGLDFSVGNISGGSFVTDLMSPRAADLPSPAAADLGSFGVADLAFVEAADLASPITIPPLPFPGQSFTPNISGNGGSGTAPTSGSVKLTSFTLGNLNIGTAYLFDKKFEGIVTDLPNQILGVNGFLGTSTSVSNGTYSFSDGIQLNDVSAEYFVYLYLEQGINFEFSEGNPYTGGTGVAAYNIYDGSPIYTPGSTKGLNDPDTVFRANFTVVPEPTSILGLITLGLLSTGSTALRRCRQNK